MNKRTKIIQISGLKGLFMVVFIGSCLAAGFIAFPAFVSMYLWNLVSDYVSFVPAINIYQGVLLWGIVAISGFIINDRKKFIVAFKSPNELSDEEMKTLMERVKIQANARALNSMILKSAKTVEKKEDNSDDKSDKKKENV